MKTKILYGDTQIAEATFEEEVEQFLVELRRKWHPKRPIVQLVHSNGNMLSAGVPYEDCYVNYIAQSNDPPYFSSLGDSSLDLEDGVVEFVMGNHATEILRRNCISFSELITVARLFHRTATRPIDAIDWEID